VPVNVQIAFNGYTTVTLKPDSERDKKILDAAFSTGDLVRISHGTDGEILLIIGKESK